MTYSTYLETWAADGLVLTEGNVRQWEMRTGIGRVGGQAGQNAPVPYRSGEMWTRKNLAPGSFVLNLWIAGDDAEAARVQYERIMRQVVRTERLVRWERTSNSAAMPGRFCLGEVVTTLDPTYVGQNLYRIGLEVHVPSGKWHGINSVTIATDAGPGLPKRLDLAALADSTAPLEDLTYRVDGPINAGWTIADVNGPDSLTYNQAIPAGSAIKFDAATWAISSPTGGVNVNPAALQVLGPRLMTVATAVGVGAADGSIANSQLQVELRGSGGGAGTKLTVTGAGSYLV